MAIATVRLFIFTLFPLILAWIVVRIDRTATSRAHRLEIVLIFLFAISVAGS